MKSSQFTVIIKVFVLSIFSIQASYCAPQLSSGCEYYWSSYADGQIYQNYVGTYDRKPVYYYGEPDAVLNSNLSSCYRWVRTSNSKGSCYVKDGNYYGAGYAGYFQKVTNCPIDDYIPLALLTIGGFGFLCIRRAQIIF